MKKILVGVIGLVALGAATAPASAADLGMRHMYTKAPMAAPVYYDWSGFYVGINGGGGSAHKSWDLVPGGGAALVSDGSHDATGGTLGGQIGYRWQMSNWVFGLEAQGNWADFSGDNISPTRPVLRDRSRIDAFGLFTGQVGYAWNNVLFYAKGGAAVASDKYDVFAVPSGAFAASASEGRWGAAVGAGLEYGFAQNWSVGVEYDHLFLGHRDITLTGPAGTENERIGQNADLGLVRLNYRWGGPVVARY
ncbi:MAG: outer membrane protein [Bradyrhizobium sp.]